MSIGITVRTGRKYKFILFYAQFPSANDKIENMTAKAEWGDATKQEIPSHPPLTPTPSNEPDLARRKRLHQMNCPVPSQCANSTLPTHTSIATNKTHNRRPTYQAQSNAKLSIRFQSMHSYLLGRNPKNPAMPNEPTHTAKKSTATEPNELPAQSMH